MLPDKYIEYIDKIKIVYANPAPDAVSVSIVLHHELVSDLIRDLNEVIADISGDDMRSSVEFKQLYSQDLHDLRNSGDKTLTQWTLESTGLSLETKFSDTTLETLRHAFNEAIGATLETNPDSDRAKRLKKYMHLALLKNFRVVLKLKQFKESVEDVAK